MSANPEVKDFKPSIIQINTKGGEKPWLPAHDAITWFRTDYPGIQSRIITRIEDIEKKIVLCEISIRDDDGQYALVSTARAVGDGSKTLERLETSAIRRALSYLGYGTVAAMAEEKGDVALTHEEAANVAVQSAKTTGEEKRAMLGKNGSQRYNSKTDRYEPADIQFGADFDGGYFYSVISPLFKAIKHRDNALAKMFRDGLLTGEMDTDKAIAAVFEKYGPDEGEPESANASVEEGDDEQG